MADDVQAAKADHDAGDEYIANRRVARVYAEGLLDVATRRNQAEEIGAELHDVVGFLDETPAAERLLASPVLGRTERGPLIREAFGGKLNQTLLDFLLVLNERGRLGLLRAIDYAYHEMLDVRAKRVRVEVRSAAPLPEDQQEQLRATLRAGLGQEPALEVSVDPSLLGGLIVRVGDDVYDSSVRTRIETIRNQLLARSSYEIQSGRDRFSNQ